MKLRSTTPASNLPFAMRVGIAASLVVIGLALPIQLFASRPAGADDYSAKIQALQKKIENYQKESNELRQKADTLQNALNQISADRAKIQAEISLKQVEHDQLVADIEATEKRIEENKRTTGDLIVRSSVSDEVPLIVRIASSENLADYIDGEASRNSVRDSIVRKTEESEKLKIQLEQKRDEVKKVLDDQKFKRDELASKESQQQKLIDDAKNSEEGYQALIRDSQSQINEFKRMQEEIIRLRAQGVGGGTYITTGGSGGYPWAGVGYPCWSASCADPWGLYYRECVSYVAWRLNAAGKGVRHFGGRGHAFQWPGTVSGYTQQSRSPSAGAALVFPAGVQGAAWTGHVMYVEQIYGDSSIRISEYNWDGRGSYSERKLTPGEYAGGIFINFPTR